MVWQESIAPNHWAPGLFCLQCASAFLEEASEQHPGSKRPRGEYALDRPTEHQDDLPDWVTGAEQGSVADLAGLE